MADSGIDMRSSLGGLSVKDSSEALTVRCVKVSVAYIGLRMPFVLGSSGGTIRCTSIVDLSPNVNSIFEYGIRRSVKYFELKNASISRRTLVLPNPFGPCTILIRSLVSNLISWSNVPNNPWTENETSLIVIPLFLVRVLPASPTGLFQPSRCHVGTQRDLQHD